MADSLRANPSQKSVTSGTIVGAGSPINVKLFKLSTQMSGVGLEAHYYHSEDNGRVCRVLFCQECEQEISSDETVLLHSIADKLVEIPKDEVKALWDAGDTMKVVSSPSLTSFLDSMVKGDIMLCQAYEVVPVDEYYGFRFKALRAALKESNSCLQMDVPINSQVRKAILLPSGILYSLYFETEIKGLHDLPGGKAAVSDVEVKAAMKAISSRRSTVGKAIPKVNAAKVLEAFGGR